MEQQSIPPKSLARHPLTSQTEDSPSSKITFSKIGRLLAHQLRTPLAVVSNELFCLREVLGEEVWQRLNNKIREISSILSGASSQLNGDKDLSEVRAVEISYVEEQQTTQTFTQPLLLVDDDAETLLSLSRALLLAGHKDEILLASSLDGALQKAAKNSPAVALIDLSLNESEGVEGGFRLLQEILSNDPLCRVIVLTGHSTPQYGVRALNLGAAHFLTKPPNLEHLSALIRDGFAQYRLRKEYTSLKNSQHSKLAGLVLGSSPASRKLRDDLLYAASNNQPLLLCGETGVGKGLCASVIHKASQRSRGKFVRYQPNFGNADLVNSDLFGHTKGSFTGATEARGGLLLEADHGTLFLDEVDELPIETQVMLLGVLQERTFRAIGSNSEQKANFRLICASNAGITECLEKGKIRRDFYHRIAHNIVQIPALRDRREDISELANHFLEEFRTKEQVNVLGFSQEVFAKLNSYEWPGNIRELYSVIEGACYRAQYLNKSYIDLDSLVLGNAQDDISSLDFNQKVIKFKQQLVNQALANSAGNQLQAAKALGIDRSTLRRIIS